MKHDNSISVIRVASMLIIVAFHCLCYNAGIWNLGNPITYNGLGLAIISDLRLIGLDFFVLISGVLYCRIEATGKYDDTKLFLDNKFKRLLVPYIIWGLLLCVIFYGHQNPLDIIYGISHLWFLLMLFEVFIIVTLTKKLWKNQGLKSSLLILLSLVMIDGIIAKANTVLHISDGKMILGLQTTLDYLPIFYAGIMIEKFKVYKKLPVNFLCRLFSILILFALTILISSDIPMPLYSVYKWLPPCLLFVFVYSSLNTAHFIAYVSKNKLLILLDKYSLAIYIVHHILIFIYLDYYPNAGSIMTNHYLLAPLVMFVIILPLSLLISMAISCLPGSKYIIGITGIKVHKEHDKNN